MKIRSNLIPPLAGIGLRGILYGPEVVADRDDREQYDQEHNERDQRHSPLRAGPTLEAHP